MLRRLMAGLLAMTTVLSLAACGQDKTPSEESSQSMSQVGKAINDAPKDKNLAGSSEHDRDGDISKGSGESDKNLDKGSGEFTSEIDEAFSDVATEARPVAEFLSALKEKNLSRISELIGVPVGILNEGNISQWIMEAEYDRILDADEFKVSRQGSNASITTKVGEFTKGFTTAFENDRWYITDVAAVSEADFVAPVDNIKANGVSLMDYMKPYGDEGGFKAAGLKLPNTTIDWEVVTPHGTFPGKVISLDKHTRRLKTVMTPELQSKFMEDATRICNGLLKLNSDSAPEEEYAEFVAGDTILQIVKHSGKPEATVELRANDLKGADAALAVTFIGPDTVQMEVKYNLAWGAKTCKSTTQLVMKYVGGKPVLVGMDGSQSSNIFSWFNDFTQAW